MGKSADYNDSLGPIFELYAAEFLFLTHGFLQITLRDFIFTERTNIANFINQIGPI